MAPTTLYTAAAPVAGPDATPRPLRTCVDCGGALDTSLAPNVRYCARDRQRRRALTYLRAADGVLHDMPQDLPAVAAARERVAEAIEELAP